MTNNFKLTLLSSVAAAAVTFMTAGTANATFGMLPHCVGTVKCGMGGAGSAKAGAAVDAAMNPALAAKMGNSYQVNLGWFAAKVRGDSHTLATAGSRGEQKSGADSFPNGSLGVNYVIDADTAFNISIVPGGGGASKWPVSRSGAFGGLATDDQSVKYEMMYLQPSYAKKMFGATYGIGGILSRATMKSDSKNGNFGTTGVSDTKEAFYGVGFQVGGVWDISQTSSFAVNLRSPVWHQSTGVYDNKVFTDPIDTPAQVTVGLSFDATDTTSVSIDYKWVNWSGGNTIGNQPRNVQTNGQSNGFGWVDQNIVMLGLEHKVDEAMTLRAGVSHGNSPITDSGVVANFLFPAIVTTHFTVGGDMNIGNGMNVGMSAYVTPEAEQYDDGGHFSANGSTGAHLAHRQYGFQLSFSNDF